MDPFDRLVTMRSEREALPTLSFTVIPNEHGKARIMEVDECQRSEKAPRRK